MYQDGNSFGEKMEGIITAGWIQVFSLLYGLLAAKIIETVWGEYKTMRASIKRCDFETFIDLRDERLSPVLYMLMTFLSASILTGFFSLKYPSLISGIIVTSTTSYVFGLIFFVVREMDDPCAGLWFIHSIPENWLKVNAKEWRNKRNQPLLEKIASETKEFAKL
jgi:uncharacterized membrane protein YcfT